MFYRVDDGDVAAASAEMGRWPGVGEGFLDLRDAWIWIAFEQFSGDDHHPVLAEAAERSLLVLRKGLFVSPIGRADLRV